MWRSHLFLLDKNLYVASSRELCLITVSQARSILSSAAAYAHVWNIYVHPSPPRRTVPFPQCNRRVALLTHHILSDFQTSLPLRTGVCCPMQGWRRPCTVRAGYSLRLYTLPLLEPALPQHPSTAHLPTYTLPQKTGTTLSVCSFLILSLIKHRMHCFLTAGSHRQSLDTASPKPARP